MELRWTLPELNRKGSCSKWCGLVKFLNCSFRSLDVLVEDEVLSVGCRWVEIFTLSQLDRDDWATLFKQFHKLFFLDLSRDILYEKIRLVSLLHAILDWTTSAGFCDFILTL